jgi:chromatin segregation and condensation protein Rec8/ScpA/Scc1 (kleisin family)
LNNTFFTIEENKFKINQIEIFKISILYLEVVEIIVKKALEKNNIELREFDWQLKYWNGFK